MPRGLPLLVLVAVAAIGAAMGQTAPVPLVIPYLSGGAGVYLDGDGAKLYFNQSGNGWSDAVVLPAPFPSDSPEQVQVADLLGTGTACLIWLSPRRGDGQRVMHYIDLMEGQNPREAVALLAETARKYPQNRNVGHLLYTLLRDRNWPMPQNS